MFKEIKDIYQFRGLFFALIARGFKAKYKNSFLGIFWSLLNPLLNVFIFGFIFSAIIKIGIKDYTVYLLCTIFSWTFFHSSLINSVVSIVEDAQFVKNAAFPVEIIPLSVTLVNFVNFLIDLLILLAALLFFGRGLTFNWLYLLILLVIEFLLVSGLSVFLAGAYVIFRDVNFILNLLLRLFFYFVPVVYTVSFLPHGLKFWYLLNPLAVVIDGFAKILFYQTAPDIGLLSVAFLESVLIFILCFGAFEKMRSIIPERL